MTVYRFRQGSRFSGDAAEVVAELDDIRRTMGVLQPEAVVERAEDDASPLHRHFEWDDAAAAHLHRLQTARMLIRAIVTQGPKGSEPQARYVYTDRDYGQIMEVVADPGRYLQALGAARRDLEAAQRRMAELLNAAKAHKTPKGDVARIMLAVQALQTANDALHAIQ
jgi:hypothetical protein